VFIGCLADFIKNIVFFYDVNPNFNNFIKIKAADLFSAALQFMKISIA